MSFKNKTAVITGAGSGIGKSLAQRFAKNGANVVMLDIHKDVVQAAADEIVANGYSAIAVPTDVTNREMVFHAADQAVQTFGEIDIWVNCAGYSKILPFLDCTQDIWDRTIAINLTGTFLGCQAAVTKMKGHGGSIINFSSQSGKKGTNNYEAYCASKFGIRGLTQSVAVEFASEKIRCNAICPNVVQTPMWDAQLSDYAKKRHIADSDVMPRFIHNTPLGRLCEYDDIWNLVEFLSSDLSSYMTGQSLNLTGGACMD